MDTNNMNKKVDIKNNLVTTVEHETLFCRGKEYHVVITKITGRNIYAYAAAKRQRDRSTPTP